MMATMSLCSRMRLVITHATLVIFLWIMVGILSTQKPFPAAFFERDMDIGHRLVSKETVPTSHLILISFLLPLLLIYLYMFAVRYFGAREWAWIRYTQLVQKERWLMPLLSPGFMVAESVGLATFFTFILKLYVGRFRPNGLSLCDYKGYRAAADSGDFTRWLELTGEWSFGDLSHCRASQADINNAHMSFPSGHASMSFAGLTALAIYMYVSFVAPATRAHQIPMFLLVLVPICGAALIAGSRCRDNYHFWGDVVCGSLIGLMCAFMAAALNLSQNPLSSALRNFTSSDHSSAASDREKLLLETEDQEGMLSINRSDDTLPL